MLTVWSVCATEKERERNGEKVITSLESNCFKADSRLSVKRWGSHWSWGLADTEDLFLFSKVLIMFFQRRNFFPCLCMTTLKSFSASNFAWTSFVFTKASGSWEQRRNLFRFSHENLLRLTFEVVALHIFGGKFLRLVETVKTVERDYAIHHLSLSSLDSRSVAADEWMQLSLVYFFVFWTSFLHSEMQNNQKSGRVKHHFCHTTFLFKVFLGQISLCNLSGTLNPFTFNDWKGFDRRDQSF